MRKAFPPPFPPLRAWTSVWPRMTGGHRGYQPPCTRAHPTMAAGAQTHTGFPPNSFQGYKGGREQNSYGLLLPTFPHFYADVSAVFIFCVSPLLCLSPSFSLPAKSGHQQRRSLPPQLFLASLELEGETAFVPTPTP